MTKYIKIREVDYIIGKNWKPTFLGESEEEIGFQKGIIAEHELVKKRYQEVMLEYKEEYSFDNLEKLLNWAIKELKNLGAKDPN